MEKVSKEASGILRSRLSGLPPYYQKLLTLAGAVQNMGQLRAVTNGTDKVYLLFKSYMGQQLFQEGIEMIQDMMDNEPICANQHVIWKDGNNEKQNYKMW